VQPTGDVPAFIEHNSPTTPYTATECSCKGAQGTTLDGVFAPLPCLPSRTIPHPQGLDLAQTGTWDENAQLKYQAFRCNSQAKATSNPTRRAAFYRRKHRAMNALLKRGRAFVDRVDRVPGDTLVGISFIDGGRLHIPLSKVDTGTLRAIQPQLNEKLRQCAGPTLC
jgi:hypothetical protein